jgi:hypothetical protein
MPFHFAKQTHIMSNMQRQFKMYQFETSFHLFDFKQLLVTNQKLEFEEWSQIRNNKPITSHCIKPRSRIEALLPNLTILNCAVG